MYGQMKSKRICQASNKGSEQTSNVNMNVGIDMEGMKRWEKTPFEHEAELFSWILGRIFKSVENGIKQKI